MDFRRLEIFLGVVEQGGFTRAADQLGISQPAVSQAIRELEAEIGTPLFLRLGRHIRATPAGEALVLSARQLRRDLEVGLANVREVQGLRSGHLDLACLPTLAIAPLAPLVGRFRSAFPDITIALADPEDSEELLAFVRSGRSELAITEWTEAPGLVSWMLDRQNYLVVLPPGSTASSPFPLRSLRTMPLVAPSGGASTRRLLDEACEGVGITPKIAVEVAQREALLPLIMAEAGVGLLPQPLAEIAGRLGCVVVQPTPKVQRDVALVHRQGPLTPAAERFAQLARADAQHDR